jgi:[protein-PII] uridylyltransferase
MRLAVRDARLINPLRSDPRANALFMDLLTSRNDPENGLRWLNEAGVFGRFMPDFGRVNAQMQFDMYHHYTVDEHTIRAIGLIARIEKGEMKQDHPLATAIIHKVVSRAARFMSRCCCTTSPRAGRRPFGAGRRNRAEAVPAPGAGRRRRRSSSPGWYATTC